MVNLPSHFSQLGLYLESVNAAHVTQDVHSSIPLTTLPTVSILLESSIAELGYLGSQMHHLCCHMLTLETSRL